MAKSELFKLYIWLIDLIYSNDGITRDEINRRWSRSALNVNKEDEIPERTFHRHKEAIKELFESREFQPRILLFRLSGRIRDSRVA